MKAFSSNRIRLEIKKLELLIGDKVTFFFILWIIGFSLCCTLVNLLFFHYHGNNYVLGKSLVYSSVLSTLYLVICDLVPQFYRFKAIFIDWLYLNFMFLILGCFVSAIQWTPFQPVDATILAWEPISLAKLIARVKSYHQMTSILITFYQSLNYVVVCFPLILIFFGRREAFRAWLKFIFISTGLGFSFYYFFPSCGPGSIIPDKTLFFQYQLDTSLKFQQIHQGLVPTTSEGGLIAFPSFHIIWSWAFVRILKTLDFRLFYLGLLWFAIMSFACVGLGWHYSLDVLGSYALIYVVENFFFRKPSKDRLILASTKS